MPRPKKSYRLGGSAAHQKLILRNLAADIIQNGKIKTTETRAKEVKPFVERMITIAKQGDLAAKRTVLSELNDEAAMHKLFEEIAPQYKDRPGGYTRIIKIGPRRGDAALIVQIELVEE
jgi:large subunit ribosomal protein L17